MEQEMIDSIDVSEFRQERSDLHEIGTRPNYAQDAQSLHSENLTILCARCDHSFHCTFSHPKDGFKYVGLTD
jgi:hypothetical protein